MEKTRSESEMILTVSFLIYTDNWQQPLEEEFKKLYYKDFILIRECDSFMKAVEVGMFFFLYDKVFALLLEVWHNILCI